MNHTPSASDDARQLVDRMFATEFAFMKAGGTDPNMLADAFHPKVIIHEPASLPYAGDWEGLPGAAALIRQMSAAWSDMSIEALEVVEAGGCVLLACRLRLTVRQTGRVIDQPFAEQLRFEDGRLVDGTPFYFDTVELVDALGDGAIAAR